MLSPEERTEIEHEMALYPIKESVAIDALKIVQKHRGWISDETLRDVAEFTGMTEAELDAIATFYNLLFRRPVGRHVIFVCDSVSCWLMGYEAVMQHIQSRLGTTFGQTTPDGRFTILPVPCLGSCEMAPAIFVDGTIYGDVTPSRIDEILDSHR